MMRTAGTGRQATASTSDRLEDGMEHEHYTLEAEERDQEGTMHTLAVCGRFDDWGVAVDTARALRPHVDGCDLVVYEYGEYENGIEVYRL